MPKIARRPDVADYAQALIFVATTGLRQPDDAKRVLESHLGKAGPATHWPRPVLECFLQKKSLDAVARAEPPTKAGEGHFLVGLLRHAEGKSEEAATHLRASEARKLDPKSLEYSLVARLKSNRSPR